MATTSLSPGVYVEEVPPAIGAIAGAGTSTAAFVGIVPDRVQLVARDPAFDPNDPKSQAFKFVDFTIPTAVKTPVLITSWRQFTRTFGDLVGDPTSRASAGSPTVDAGYQQLVHAVYGFFKNGGTQCYVARITAESDLDAVLNAFAAIDEIAIVCAPGQIADGIRDKIVAHCALVKNRIAILDGPQVMQTLTTLTGPAADATPGVMPRATDFAAWYYPWIQVFDPGTQLQNPSGDGSIAVPPSGHVAGICARVETERGVFKSPANEVIRGALNVTRAPRQIDQDVIDADELSRGSSLDADQPARRRTTEVRSKHDVKVIVRHQILESSCRPSTPTLESPSPRGYRDSGSIRISRTTS